MTRFQLPPQNLSTGVTVSKSHHTIPSTNKWSIWVCHLQLRIPSTPLITEKILRLVGQPRPVMAAEALPAVLEPSQREPPGLAVGDAQLGRHGLLLGPPQRIDLQRAVEGVEVLVTADGLVPVEAGTQAVKGPALGEVELVFHVQGEGAAAAAGGLVVCNQSVSKCKEVLRYVAGMNNGMD